MEILSRHIEYLLLRKECVILPGMGAFIATHHSSVIDREKGCLLPPRREVSFNSEVKNDDGVLANSISRVIGCSFEEGRVMALQIIERLLSIMDQQGNVDFGNIGTLEKDESGAILFRERYDHLRREKLSGLPAIALNWEEEECVESVATKMPEEINGDRISSESERYYHLRIPKTAVRYVALMLIILCVGVGVMVNNGKSERETTRYASILPVELSENRETSKDMISEEQVCSVTPLSASIEEPVEPLESEEAQESCEQKKYYLIIGTFATKAGAERYASQIEGAGAEVCGSSSGIWRVSLASSDSREELQRKMMSEGIYNRYSGSWIWESNGVKDKKLKEAI